MYLALKGTVSKDFAPPNLHIFWNETYKNITDWQLYVQFPKSQNHFTLVALVETKSSKNIYEFQVGLSSRFYAYKVSKV